MVIFRPDGFKVLKELRKQAGLTQNELAEGICTQAQISKIENGYEIPSSLILYEISQRLGVDMNYFFLLQETPRLDYVNEVHSLVRKYIRERNYVSVHEIIRKEKNNPLFYRIEDQQFFLWHEGICCFYLEHDSDRSLHMLQESLHLRRNKLKLTRSKKFWFNEREIEILNSIGVIENEMKQYESSIATYRDAFAHLLKRPQIKNVFIQIRILYNLSKSYTEVEQYETSLKYCENGIEQCIQNESLYLLGELYYQKGLNLYHLKKNSPATVHFNKALELFKLLENESFCHMVRSQVKKLNIEM